MIQSTIPTYMVCSGERWVDGSWPLNCSEGGEELEMMRKEYNLIVQWCTFFIRDWNQDDATLCCNLRSGTLEPLGKSGTDSYRKLHATLKSRVCGGRDRAKGGGSSWCHEVVGLRV